jgi:hypothetical protein
MSVRGAGLRLAQHFASIDRKGSAASLMNDWSEAESHVERAHELYEAGRWDEA